MTTPPLVTKNSDEYTLFLLKIMMTTRLFLLLKIVMTTPPFFLLKIVITTFPFFTKNSDHYIPLKVNKYSNYL